MARNWEQDYDRDYNRDYNRENRFTRFFDDFLSDAKTHVNTRFRSAGDGRRQPNWIPTIDVTENEREYSILVDVPGVRKEDIDVEFNDSVLVLSGHHKRDSTTSAAQNVNVKHDHDYRQPPEATNYQPNQYPQSNQYQQQPPNEQQQQPPNEQQQQPPNEQQQQPLPQQPPQQSTEYPQPPPKQQQTEYQSSQQPPTDHQQSSNQQSNQQPTEFHRLKKSHKDHKDGGDHEKIHIQERHYGYFSRSIQLPSNIRNDVEFPAKLENGVLRITVPKNNERPKRKITIM